MSGSDEYDRQLIRKYIKKKDAKDARDKLELSQEVRLQSQIIYIHN